MRNALLVLAVLLLTAAVMSPSAIAESPESENAYLPANPFSQHVPRQAVYMKTGVTPAPAEWDPSMADSQWLGPPPQDESYSVPPQFSQQCPQQYGGGQQYGRGPRYGNRPYQPMPGYTLPAGRRYFNGRYFGNFNNRFYGPQYGYF